MHFDVQGQWWSYPIIQTSQYVQWKVDGGISNLHFLQKLHKISFLPSFIEFEFLWIAKRMRNSRITKPNKKIGDALSYTYNICNNHNICIFDVVIDISSKNKGKETKDYKGRYEAKILLVINLQSGPRFNEMYLLSINEM